MSASAPNVSSVFPTYPRTYMLGHGKSAKPAGSLYSIPEQGSRVGAALDRLGVNAAIVVGHSTGGSVATALTELRRDLAKGLVRMGVLPVGAFLAPAGRADLVTRVPMGGSCSNLDADSSDGHLSRLLPVPIVGYVLWRLLTGPM